MVTDGEPRVLDLAGELIDPTLSLDACYQQADPADHGSSSGLFEHWQRVYADRRIATVPCSAEKRPFVSNPQRFGLRASQALALRFPDASVLGFCAGRRNGLTVLDVDTTDERILGDALDRHGYTPLIVRTASGNYHALYRHNGERRKIRPWGKKGLPIDVLGAGLCIAPPSSSSEGQYQIIKGCLDDLDHLPIMRGLDAHFYLHNQPTLSPTSDPAKPWPEMREGDGRNDALFRQLGREAHDCDDFEQLLDLAQTRNAGFGQPLTEGEISKIARSIWKMTIEGRNRFGRHGSWLSADEVDALVAEPCVLALLSYLQAHNGPDSQFWVADGLSHTLGWSRRQFKDARRRLIDAERIIPLNSPRPRHPVFYRWGR